MTDAIEAPARKRRTLADEPDAAKILWYGEQGTGKTINLATLARRGPVIFVNAEKGLKRRPLRQWDVPLDNIELAEARSYAGLEALYWDVRKRIETHSAEAPIGIDFDSITEIVKVVTEGQVMTRVQRKQAEADAMMVNPKEADVNPFRIQLDDYGVMTEQMRHLVRLFRDLPIHMGSSALTRRDVDASGGGETGDSVVYRPGLPPKFGADMVGYMDIVVATKIAIDGQYVGVTKPRFGLVGKDRFGVLPTTMVDPTFDRILAVINDELTAEEVRWIPPVAE